MRCRSFKDELLDLKERRKAIYSQYAEPSKKVEGSEAIYFAAGQLVRAAKREAEREMQPQKKPREREWKR
jgi:hypothetical protein